MNELTHYTPYAWSSNLICPLCRAPHLVPDQAPPAGAGVWRGVARVLSTPKCSSRPGDTFLAEWDTRTREARVVPPAELANRGSWILTHTHTVFFPAAPLPGDVHLLDIAHALAHVCRYNGHGGKFYSVAEHSVLLARAARETGRNEHVQRAALFHDATEAYVGDVTRPVKQLLGETYARIERGVARVIQQRFGLPLTYPWVHDADQRICVDEMTQLFGPDSFNNTPDSSFLGGTGVLGANPRFWSPDEAKAEFLSLAAELGITEPTGAEFPEPDVAVGSIVRLRPLTELDGIPWPACCGKKDAERLAQFTEDPGVVIRIAPAYEISSNEPGRTSGTTIAAVTFLDDTDAIVDHAPERGWSNVRATLLPVAALVVHRGQ